jgi:mycothiol system anti-sigma-R factor
VTSKEGVALRCAGIQRFADTYLDGEFADRDRAEFETHLASCESCRVRIQHQAEFKRQLKAAAPREKAPAALRNRVLRSIRKEQQPQRAWRRWSARALPVAAAGGLLATLIVSRVSFTPVAADVIAKHQRNLPVEITGRPDQVAHWYDGKVDFSVRVPQFGSQVALRGGRLANIRDRQAAYLVYDVHGNKVSVFIFDPGELPLDAPKKQVIGNREVFFDEERGYNVALYRDRGVGYAIASDLDSDQMYKLVSTAVDH